MEVKMKLGTYERDMLNCDHRAVREQTRKWLRSLPLTRSKSKLSTVVPIYL